MEDEQWVKILKKQAPDLVDRAEYVPEFGPSSIPSIKLGILFVMAVWSGTSHIAIKKLNEVLPKADPVHRVRLFIADTDQPDALLKIPELKGKLGGYGEMAWIHLGKIIATSGRGYEPNIIETKTKYLTSLPTPRFSA